MTSTLTVPASLEEIVQRYDAKEEPFTRHDIEGELRAASAGLVEPSEAERAGAWAEYLTFALETGQHKGPWNTYFGPMASKSYPDGTIEYFPDPSLLAP